MKHEGGCACGAVRYRLTAAPLFVHGCHCTDCQTETGSAFATNALIEAGEVELLQGEPVRVDTPSASGKGQAIWRCPRCFVALWSNYVGAGEAIRFLRAGTLDDPGDLQPDVHIYVRSKRPWVILPEGVPAFETYYDMKALWPAESWARVKAARGGPSRG